MPCAAIPASRRDSRPCPRARSSPSPPRGRCELEPVEAGPVERPGHPDGLATNIGKAAAGMIVSQPWFADQVEQAMRLVGRDRLIVAPEGLRRHDRGTAGRPMHWGSKRHGWPRMTAARAGLHLTRPAAMRACPIRTMASTRSRMLDAASTRERAATASPAGDRRS